MTGMPSTLEPTSTSAWYRIADEPAVPSPSLLVYRDRLEANLRRMIAVAGGTDRLRPHIKTHKMPDLVCLQLRLGITKFKCATIAEAEMAARCGAPDVLLAYPLVGPNIRRFASLVASFPDTRFSTLCDQMEPLDELSRELAVHAAGLPAPRLTEVLLDLDVGQHRTGVPAGARAAELYAEIGRRPNLAPGGLHAYDGHIHDPDLSVRTAACDVAFAPVIELRNSLLGNGLPVPRVVAGGTPTFAMHARRLDVECSPGTCVFWDAGYAVKLAEMNFLPAALVLTRVISKPGTNQLCLDLGHKAIASEMPQPRACLLNLTDLRAVSHSEEHWVVESSQADRFRVGDCLYALPWHICPTVALHAEAVVISEGRPIARWKISARDRRITI